MGRSGWSIGRTVVALALVVAAGAGCSSTRLGRPRVAPGVRTITTVGDTPDSVVAGMPGASAGSGPLIVERPVGRDGRVHGRVVDERGRPVSDVEVRVADGGAQAGRDLSAVTDAAGGFTLRGLRPDETYTLVASRPGARGGLYGRRRVIAPDGGVEIVLRAAGEARSARRPETRRDEPEAAAAVARPLDDEPELERSVVRRASVAETDPWRSTSDSTSATSHRMPLVDAPADTYGRARSVMGLPIEDDEDEINPLPPAIERPAPSSRSAADGEPIAGAEPSGGPRADSGRRIEPEPFTSGDGPLVPSFPDPDAETAAPGDELDRAPAAADRPAPEADAPPSVPPPSTAPEGPLDPSGDLSEFRPVEPEPAAPPMPLEGDEGVPAIEPPAASVRRESPRSDPPRPTWGELAARSEARARAVSETAPTLTYPRSVRRLPRPEPLPPPAVASAPGAGRDGGLVRASVRFDNRAKRLVDFTLADLDGRPVTFSELDADYVLLDFWGTWCAPCAKTMPHLVELQGRYDPSRLRVVGIAYERGPLPEQVAAVRAMAADLGVNYPILLGEQDGRPCPLLAALRVDQYPTLILLDRQGRILWRDSGSRAEMLARLDRVIAANARWKVETRRR